MLAMIGNYHRELGLAAPTMPEQPSLPLEGQLEAVLAARVPVFSFTFGIPEARWIEAFRRTGTKVVGTATTVGEGVELERAGVDAVVAQGEEAGGHRGTFRGAFEEAMVPVLELVRGCVGAVRVPVIASGGIMDGAGVRAALAAGARAERAAGAGDAGGEAGGRAGEGGGVGLGPAAAAGGQEGDGGE
jgi:nitronate monooxygenase